VVPTGVGVGVGVGSGVAVSVGSGDGCVGTLASTGPGWPGCGGGGGVIEPVPGAAVPWVTVGSVVVSPPCDSFGLPVDAGGVGAGGGGALSGALPGRAGLPRRGGVGWGAGATGPGAVVGAAVGPAVGAGVATRASTVRWCVRGCDAWLTSTAPAVTIAA